MFFIVACGKNDIKEKKKDKVELPDVEISDNFNMNLIKLTRRKQNYLISPYSIEIALNMLNDGANEKTKEEISRVLPDRKINDVSIKNRIKIANALFIKDEYKNKVKDEYKNELERTYDSEILYDKFKTPDVINDWVNKKTDGMITKILDKIDPDFAIGLANAVAIDVNWASEFECTSTTKEEFTKVDNKKIDVEMMHKSYKSGGFKYLKSSDATGIIIPYKSYDKKTGEEDYQNGSYLEFIGILPNESVEDYIVNLTEDKLNGLIDSGKPASNKYQINLSLPRFKYEYEIPNFKEVLMGMGIKSAFSENEADFSNIIHKKDMKNNLYIGDAIHKTYIDLNEKGTKAAAVTFFGLNSAMMIEDEKEEVDIKFNKPFIYIIIIFWCCV
jgi:serine protease inhibitor